MSDMLMPKNQALVERLRRRFEKYRSRHDECVPRFEHTTNGLSDQHKQETFILRQRYLDSKAKKTGKKSDKSNKHHHNSNSNNQSAQDGNGGLSSMVRINFFNSLTFICHMYKEGKQAFLFSN